MNNGNHLKTLLQSLKIEIPRDFWYNREEMPEKFSAMGNSADSKESADSLIGNANSPSLEQFNSRVELEKEQRKFHEEIDNQDSKRAEINLTNELSFLGVSQSVKEKKQIKDNDLDVDKELSIADQIKNYKEELTKQGKSQSEILSLLILNFENNEIVSKWIKSWRNFQKLHNFAETKPPAERQAIQKIISKADFTNESAFSTSLAEISQSAEISATTKLEIAKEFGGGVHIDSVDGMDYQLKQIKEHTQAIEEEIGLKSREKSSLDSEIENLEDELDTLPLDDPKRQELEGEIEQKKEVLEEIEITINDLKEAKPKNVSFQLREGFNSVLNPDGSRSIKIIDSDFLIKLPSSRWLFSDKKNMRAINLAFPYVALKNQNLAGILFRPNLENGSIPSKSQRDLGYLILSSLGYDDRKILSQENIKQLNKDLSMLNPKNGKPGLENMIEIGVYDVASQSLNKIKLKKVLILVRENRSIADNTIYEIIN